MDTASILALLIVAIVLYAILYRRSLSDQRAPWPITAVSAFTAGLITVFAALIWPLDSLTDTFFWAHMLQHMILLLITPPLLLLGLPVPALLRTLPGGVRRHIIKPLAKQRLVHQLGYFLANPLTVFVLFNSCIGFWHIPIFFIAATETVPLHIAEHLSFLIVGLLFWWMIIEPLPVWPRDAALAKMVFLVVCHLPMLFLGQFLLFAPIPLYAAAYATTPHALPLLADQRLGGAIMVGIDFAVAFIVISILFARYLQMLEERQRAREALLDHAK